MGSTSVNDAKKWLQQHQPIPTRVAALVMRCARDGMKPNEIKMSSDLYGKMVKAACKTAGKEFDSCSLPATLTILLGNHKLKIVHAEEMPQASMHATR